MNIRFTKKPLIGLAIGLALIACFGFYWAPYFGFPRIPANAPVTFDPRSDATNSFQLPEQSAVVIRSLAREMESHKWDHSSKSGAFMTLMGIARFEVGDHSYEWYEDFLFRHADRGRYYLVIHDPRLGACYQSLRSSGKAFDPSETKKEEWKATFDKFLKN